MSVLISVIIPVRNGDETLLNLLRKLLIYRKHYSIEIIIIDSESDNKTALEIRKRFSRSVRIVGIKKSDFNHGETRNLGARIAKGKYVCYFSQDISIPNPLFLHRFPELLEKNKRAVAVFGRQIPYPASPPLEKLNMQTLYRALGRFVNAEGILVQDKNSPFAPLRGNEYLWYTLSNAFSCYRREFLTGHPFPESSYGEDLLAGKSIIEKGRAKIYDSKSTCIHSHNHSTGEYLTRQLEEIRLRKKMKIPHFRLGEKIRCLMRDQKRNLGEKTGLFFMLGFDYALRGVLYLYFRTALALGLLR